MNKYVCIKNTVWMDCTGRFCNDNNPKYLQIVTLNGVHVNPYGQIGTYFSLEEFPSSLYHSSHFIPYEQWSQQQSESILETITKQVEIEIEEPILN